MLKYVPMKIDKKYARFLSYSLLFSIKNMAIYMSAKADKNRRMYDSTKTVVLIFYPS